MLYPLLLCVLTFFCASLLASLCTSLLACVLPAFVDTTLGLSRSADPGPVARALGLALSGLRRSGNPALRNLRPLQLGRCGTARRSPGSASRCSGARLCSLRHSSSPALGDLGRSGAWSHAVEHAVEHVFLPLLYECWLVAVCLFFCLFADSHICRAWLHECLCVCFFF